MSKTDFSDEFYIHLMVKVPELLKRIKTRNVISQDKIGSGYLKSLDENYQEYLKTL